MAASHVSGPFVSTAGFGAAADSGLAGAYTAITKQVTGIAQATATDILTVTVPNASGGAGGRILCSSTITQTSHVGDSTRTVEYIWSVTRLADAVAVITISIITGGTVIATKAAGYTLTSTIAATAVTGGATASNSFTFQVTNTGSTSSTTTATLIAECLNYGGTNAFGSSGPTGVTIS